MPQSFTVAVLLYGAMVAHPELTVTLTSAGTVSVTVAVVAFPTVFPEASLVVQVIVHLPLVAFGILDAQLSAVASVALYPAAVAKVWVFPAKVYFSSCVNLLDARLIVISTLDPSTAEEAQETEDSLGIVSSVAVPLQFTEVSEEGGRLPEAEIATLREPSVLCAMVTVRVIATVLELYEIARCTPVSV